MARYYVPSDSTDTKYIVAIARGSYTCTCIGFRFNRRCKHGKRVLENPTAFQKTEDAIPWKNVRFDPVKGRLIVKRTKVIGPEFVKPMLAATVKPEDIDFVTRSWSVEEKYDGHRLIVCVQEGMVVAWARSGKRRTLPKHLEKALSKFPNGTYDGELCVPHGRSYNVTETDRAHERCYVIFDVIRLLDKHVYMLPYEARRQALTTIFKSLKVRGVLLAESTPVQSWKQVTKVCGEIWDRDGEGVIVKDRASVYEIGTRSTSFVKVKKLRSAVLRLYAFKEGLWGPCSKLQLVDKQGNRTSVKVKTLSLLKQIQNNPKKYIGRMVRIDYQERTPDGGYRHPRMDRFEDE